MTRGQKAAETRRKNKERMLKEMGVEERPKRKIKRKRKPMSEEQRQAAIERLAKARAKRGATGTASVHDSLLDTDPESKIHWTKVKEWIKSCQEELRGMKSYKDSKEAAHRQEYHSLETYIDNLKKYLSTGVYLDYRYGERREGRMQEVCFQLAYYPDGTPKRSVGVYYPDIGQIWTREMQEMQYGGNEPTRVYPKLYDEEEFQSDGGEPGEDD
jgi:hypothetical protein